MQEQELKDLLERFHNGTATEAEKALLENWYLQYREEDDAQYSLNERLEDADMIWAQLQPEANSRPARKLWPRITVAASILVCFGLAFYYVQKNHAEKSVTIAHNDIKAGGNKAILTLADGRQISLSDAAIGHLTAQGGTSVTKTTSGQVIYRAQTGIASADKIAYNTINTPRGGQYQVILPDGTHVWLNAASSIRFPTAFNGKDREVSITGEAYFEVVHNPEMPFRVKSEHQVTEDIGTSFNINTYADEKAAVTTLIEGAIAVNKKLLKPGQAAVIENGGAIKLAAANTANVLAWKNGFFSFKQASVEDVMRQFARWYDVEVVYEAGIPQGSITGSVYRNANASQALQILSYLNIHYHITGKKIVITR